MSIKNRIKQMIDGNNPLLYFGLNIYNHMPFNNSYSLHGNKCCVKSAFLQGCRIIVRGGDNTIIIEKGCRLKNCRFYINGRNNKITLSEYVFAEDAEFYIEDNNNSIAIGEHTSLCGKIHLACTEGTEIDIGADCLMSSEIVFRTGDSHSICNRENERINHARSITIGDHVWICHRVLINKGVTVRDNTVIGTGAVVTSAFEQPNIIIAGVPARIIKENIQWSSKR